MNTLHQWTSSDKVISGLWLLYSKELVKKGDYRHKTLRTLFGPMETLHSERDILVNETP